MKRKKITKGLIINRPSEIKIRENMTTFQINVDDRHNDSQFLGAGKRMLIYSHDTFGLGHLQRCLKISRVLSARYPKLSILLITGSPLVHRYPLPSGTDYVKLPAVRKIGPEKYEARTLGTSYRRILAIRTNIILQTIQDYNPHMLLVDHSPTGMKGEMLPALEWLKKSNSPCIKVLGLRDIIDEPDLVIDLWDQQGIYEVLQELYDHILVYGTKEVYDLFSAYHFSPDLQNKTHYCNYIGEFLSNGNNLETKNKKPKEKNLVVVTIGGGDGAGEIVIGTYLEMLRLYENQIDFDSILLPGPFLSAELSKKFRKACNGLPVTYRQFVPGARSLFQRSDLVVSTGGYNTVTEILSCARRALIIPRILHRKEQLIRAQRLQEMGLLTLLHPDQVTPSVLYEKVISLLSTYNEPLTESRARNLIKFDGASRLADFCGKLFLEHSSKKEAIK